MGFSYGRGYTKEDGGEKMLKDLVKMLVKDKGCYEGWKANIAMSFVDEYRRTKKKDIKKIANNAADNFLKLLMRDKEE